MNSSFRIPLLLIAGFSLFIGCKKDNPSPSSSSSTNSGTSCQLVSSQYITTGSYTSSGSNVFTYNSQNQVVSVLYNYSGGSPSTITFQYDSQGRPVSATSSGAYFADLIYDANGNISRVNNTQNGTSTGYSLYSYASAVIQQSNYTALGVLSSTEVYTISGSNIVQSLQTEYDATSSKITRTYLDSYSGFDSNLSAVYVAYQGWPTMALLLEGGSKNNPSVRTEISTSYTNGVAGTPYTTTTYYTYTYNSSGAVTKQISTVTYSGQSNVTTTNYVYSGCN